MLYVVTICDKLFENNSKGCSVIERTLNTAALPLNPWSKTAENDMSNGGGVVGSGR